MAGVGVGTELGSGVAVGVGVGTGVGVGVSVGVGSRLAVDVAVPVAPGEADVGVPVAVPVAVAGVSGDEDVAVGGRVVGVTVGVGSGLRRARINDRLVGPSQTTSSRSWAPSGTRQTVPGLTRDTFVSQAVPSLPSKVPSRPRSPDSTARLAPSIASPPKWLTRTVSLSTAKLKLARGSLEGGPPPNDAATTVASRTAATAITARRLTCARPWWLTPRVGRRVQ